MALLELFTTVVMIWARHFEAVIWQTVEKPE